MKKPEDALYANKMNVNDKGKQPFMKWNGEIQQMVTR